MIDRLPCVVPGCKCTMRLDPEWPNDDQCLCRKHWPMVPLAWRVLYRKARRSDRHRLAGMLWRKMERQAIERSMGL